MLSHPAALASKSPLKWAGGKSKLLGQLLPLLPKGARLIEPFVGAGSVFLAADYGAYVLNDANPDLMAMWAALQCRPRDYLERAAALFIEENRSQESYLRIRKEFNESVDRFERAIRLVYLNKFGFNGLFRVNARGEYNVPYGKAATLPLFPFDAMEAAARKLERCHLMSGGFEAAIAIAESSDVIYCDPPYSDSSSGESFSKYTAEGFGPAHHARLVEAAQQASLRGVTVLVSNHDTPHTRKLYRGWRLHPLQVGRTIAAAPGGRRVAQELVAELAPRSA